MTTIELETATGKRAVEATTFGPHLAVHEGYDCAGCRLDVWVVTHIPTGRAMAKCYCRVVAVQIATVIETFADRESLASTDRETVTRAVPKSIRRLCQAITDSDE